MCWVHQYSSILAEKIIQVNVRINAMKDTYCCKALLILWDNMNIRGKINSAGSPLPKVTLNVGFHFSVAKKYSRMSAI
jgi:hypothetical protein